MLEEGAHEKSPKCLGGNLGDFGEFCKGLNLQIGFKTIRPNSSASKNGMPIYSNVSRREIFDLYEQYSGQRPDFRNIPNKGQLSSTTITSGGGFAFEVQLSLTEKGQYAVAYGLSCKKDCHELHATDPRRTIP
ncbi:hypothetical protein, partial [Neisseria meningitidis]|uniref:hypothetical protein n=3 Tax=Neisseria meningitidis TaxID=487 RepID=UPI001956DCCB